MEPVHMLHSADAVNGINAVIFDMDGTLIDTEKLNVRFWIEAGRAFGYDISYEDVLHIRSLDGRLVKSFFEGKYSGFDFNEVREKRRALMNEYVNEYGVELKPGVKELLQYLKTHGIKTAVATASRPDHALRYLKMTGILDYFTEVVYTSSVDHGKPEPDVYIYACNAIGEDPKNCIAVEDSPNGVRSAYDAGCSVVFIPDLSEADEEIRSKATVFGCMSEFMENIC